MQKKILVVKHQIDISHASDAQIELMKAYYIAGFPPEQQKQLSFEVLIEDTEAAQEKLMEHIRQEFRRQDTRRERRRRK